MATSNSTTPAGLTLDPPIFIGNLIPTRSLKMWAIGVILSALAYGIEITLAFYCFQLLSKPSRQQHTSRRTQRVLLFFVAFMCLLGTTALVVNINALINSLTTPFQVFEKFSYPVKQILLFAFTPVDLTLIVLATWGSHGSMLWRCNALYADLPPLRRILFLILASLIVLTSFIFGMRNILTLIPFFKENGENADSVGILIGSRLTQFELASLCTNITISLLSAGRILYHLLYLRKIFGAGHTTVYERVVMILVESSSLPLVPDILLLVASASSTNRTNGKPNLIRDLIFAHQKLILHINIIAPILIIFRVAQGQTLPCSTQTSRNNAGGADETQRGKISTLRFAGGDKGRDTESFGGGDDIEQEAEFVAKEKVEPEVSPTGSTPLYLEYKWTPTRSRV